MVQSRNISPDPLLRARGRGSSSRQEGRYERFASTPFDDGWGTFDEPAPNLRTRVTPESAKRIITCNASPDVGFDRTINPYQGCEHGCIYCFARPRHAFYGLSPGLDFESQLFAKENAATLLEQELRKPGYEAAPIGLGVNTDCYQPIEKSYRITRQVLEVLEAYSHPVYIVTKSAMILRDIDILQSLAARNLVSVYISVTTLDRQLARHMEPRAATPARRLDTIRALNDGRIPVGVLVAPMIPGLTDHELDSILQHSADAGAQSAGYVALRLPLEIRDLFEEWLITHYPDKARKVLSLIHDIRGGRANDPRFGSRMKGTGPYATLLGDRFKLACERYGLSLRKGEEKGQVSSALDSSQFALPPRPGDQLALFDAIRP